MVSALLVDSQNDLVRAHSLNMVYCLLRDSSNQYQSTLQQRILKRFIEKPNASKAQELLLQGGVLWNAGIFLVSVDTLLKALQTHAPDIL